MKFRWLRFWWQRRTRGWDDSETWGLDTSLARLILPRLRRFREIGAVTATPVNYCLFDASGDITAEANDAWLRDIGAMIAAFEWVGAANRDDTHAGDHQPGFDLFAKHYLSLWW
jgi:hypothetical protein